MSVSVIVVTYNRPKEAVQAVQSLLNQTLKPLEIILIDNGSTPPFEEKFKDLRVKQVRFDEESGLSNARNYGIKIAQGNYIAFIDDDCFAEKHWLENIQKGITAQADVLGGPLRPRFRSKPPSWWSEKDLGYFVGVGNNEKQDIWGGNMIFKKDFFQRIGLFNPNVGRRKGKLLAGEDSDLISKGKNSCKIMFIPDAVVFHLVRSERLTLSYLIRWSFNSGRSQRIACGRPSPLAIYKFMDAYARWLNPFAQSGKSGRIRKVAVMVEQLGTII
jgi:glycosyltransferase involved in cell wall biosynthesis